MSDQAPECRTVPTPPALPSEAAGPQKLSDARLAEIKDHLGLLETTSECTPGNEALAADYRFLIERAEKAESRLHQEQQDAADQAAQLLVLHEESRKLQIVLARSLSALADMWSQYCPNGHDFMSAGENTEDVLAELGLMRPDGSAIDVEYDTDIPDAVVKLLGRTVWKAENEEVAASLPVQGEPVGPPLCACGNETLSIVSGICLSCAALI